MADVPWFKRKRCETGDGDPQTMECMVCGAYFGEACRQRETVDDKMERDSDA